MEPAKRRDAATARASLASALLSPATFRGLTLKNRLVISPMCMYSAKDGALDDFHLVHLGRITQGCAGLWNDAQIEPMKRVAEFLHRFGSAAGIQLSHAGHKGSSQRPWEGGGPLGQADLKARGDESWEPQGVTSAPFDAGWATPAEMSAEDIATVTGEFATAAKRADTAGFDVIEVHCAHGYLLHSFLSPISNTRGDAYGGDLEGRVRFPLEVVAAVRDVWPVDKPLFVRISSVDGIDVGWGIDDSVALAKALKAIGVDVIDCSSGGMKLERQQNFLWRGPGFHVPFAEQIRSEADIPTVAVGLIRDAEHAEAILADGKADLVSVAREALYNPNWPAAAALALEGESAWDLWPEQFGWWLMRRARQERDRKRTATAPSR